MEKDQDPTIVVEDSPEQEKYELLKEKLKYKQAERENSKKIDHKQVRLNIQADALPSKTFFIMNALAAVIAGYGLLSNSAAVVIGAMLVAMMLGRDFRDWRLDALVSHLVSGRGESGLRPYGAGQGSA